MSQRATSIHTFETLSKKIKRIAVLTSGGDAPGMNAAIRALVLAAHKYHIEVIGFAHGYNGLLTAPLEPQAKLAHTVTPRVLTLDDVNGIIHRGGTILKSARCSEMKTVAGLQQAANTLNEQKIDALVVIGGDGSFNGLIALQQHWQGQVIGLPGTIDNDLDGTDFTIGFSTAVNTALEAVDKIRDTADAFERVFIVELMGRHSGHIAFNVGIACAAEQIISFENFPKNFLGKHNENDVRLAQVTLSEENFAEKAEAATLAQLAEDIQTAQKNRHESYIIVIAENLWRGGAMALAQQLKAVSGIDCTACILGHIQRGGSPVAKDRLLATKMGVAAIQALAEGKTGVMVAEQNSAISFVPLAHTIKHKKLVNSFLVNAQENILAVTAQSQY